MKSFAVLAVLGAAVAPAFATIVPRQTKGKLPAVSVKGNAFFAGDNRFYVRGVAYQPGGAADAQDPLLDLENLKRDVENFKSLGINTIRVYTIDNSKNHDEGMKMLDDAGIYLALDANTPKYSLNRQNGATLHRSYNDVYLQNVFATIDSFADYNNLLLFFSGNEVINEKNNTNAAPYIKAVTRDMKQYISNRKGRSIPVGYSAADVAENIEAQALYFNCGSDDARLTSSPSTTTPGVIPLPSPSPAGTRRYRPTRTTASPSSYPSSAASRTLVSGVRLPPSTTPT
jgi:hypothetical protein